MNSIYKILSLLFLVVLVGSCKKYLDVTPDNTATIADAFSNRNEALNYLYTCYSTLQKLADVKADPGFTTSSEIVFPGPTYAQGEYTDVAMGFYILRGTQTAVSPALDFWDGENLGVPLFEGIRRCNIFLDNINSVPHIAAYERDRWIGEAEFLKAYYHFWLLRMYGPIPVMKQDIPVSGSTNEVRVKRQPVDSVFSYIVQLLDEAVTKLPDKLPNPSTEMGRITKPIALCVKAKVLMEEASPLFNGNPDYAGFKDKDGTPLFPATYDPDKWKTALAACKAAVDECEAQGFSLYHFIPTAFTTGISDSLTQLLTLQNAVTEEWRSNSGLIWAYGPYFQYQNFAAPKLTSFAVTQVVTVVSSFAVPIQTAELFYTNHGVPINQDKTWDYTGRYNVKTAGNVDKFYIKPGYQTATFNFDRGPRFYAWLAFDGSSWYGNGVFNQDNMLYVQGRGPDAYAGPHDLTRINITGYWPKKLVDYQTSYFLNDVSSYSVTPFRLPVIRLAGLYLLYAEALNEVNGPTDEVFQYIDKVRARAGLPGVKEAWTQYSTDPSEFTTKDGMRKIIHRERRIELCFEGQSGWDLRRWKELQGVLSNPVTGWNIKNTDAQSYYTPQSVLSPIFGIKDYLWPIKESDLEVNPNLVQNPYW